MKQKLAFLFLVTGMAVYLCGCVSKTVFKQEMDARDERIASLESELEKNETRMDRHEERLNELSQSTQEALQRADQAGELAKGKFLYEMVLSNDDCKFEINQTELTEVCRGLLDSFIERISTENKDVYIEIQGHTDNMGDENVNFIVGRKRAEAVYHYLGTHGIPLHRMNVISYGETAPIADNSTLEGRQENRRVVIVVLE